MWNCHQQIPTQSQTLCTRGLHPPTNGSATTQDMGVIGNPISSNIGLENIKDGGHAPYGVGGIYGCRMLLCLLLVTAACPRQQCFRRWEDRGLVSLALLAFALVYFHDACVDGQWSYCCWRGGWSPHVHGVGDCVGIV